MYIKYGIDHSDNVIAHTAHGSYFVCAAHAMEDLELGEKYNVANQFGDD